MKYFSENVVCLQNITEIVQPVLAALSVKELMMDGEEVGHTLGGCIFYHVMQLVVSLSITHFMITLFAILFISLLDFLLFYVPADQIAPFSCIDSCSDFARFPPESPPGVHITHYSICVCNHFD